MTPKPPFLAIRPSCPGFSPCVSFPRPSFYSTTTKKSHEVERGKGESSVDEVDAEKVQDQAAEDIVGKSPLRTNGLELARVLRVSLYPQAGREDELADRGTEARQESIERIIPAHDAVPELQHPDHDQEAQEGVHQLRPLRRRPHVPRVYALHDRLRVLRLRLR